MNGITFDWIQWMKNYILWPLIRWSFASFCEHWMHFIAHHVDSVTMHEISDQKNKEEKKHTHTHCKAEFPLRCHCERAPFQNFSFVRWHLMGAIPIETDLTKQHEWMKSFVSWQFQPGVQHVTIFGPNPSAAIVLRLRVYWVTNGWNDFIMVDAIYSTLFFHFISLAHTIYIFRQN